MTTNPEEEPLMEFDTDPDYLLDPEVDDYYDIIVSYPDEDAELDDNWMYYDDPLVSYDADLWDEE